MRYECAAMVMIISPVVERVSFIQCLRWLSGASQAKPLTNFGREQDVFFSVPMARHWIYPSFVLCTGIILDREKLQTAF